MQWNSTAQPGQKGKDKARLPCVAWVQEEWCRHLLGLQGSQQAQEDLVLLVHPVESHMSAMEGVRNFTLKVNAAIKAAEVSLFYQPLEEKPQTSVPKQLLLQNAKHSCSGIIW